MSELATADKPWSRKQTLKENAAIARASRYKRLQEEVHVASESDDFNESFPNQGWKYFLMMNVWISKNLFLKNLTRNGLDVKVNTLLKLWP